MKQNFVRFFSSDDVLRGKVKNTLKAEPMCINHTVRTFVENRSTLATSCSLKPAVPKYIFPDFDTLGLALLRNSSQDARYRQIEKKGRVHWTSTREKFRANCVDDIFFWGGCLSFTNCFGTSGCKVNETRPYGLFQGKFPGATEHLKRLPCFFLYWTKCSKRKFVFH